MANAVKDIDKGWQEIEKQVLSYKRSSVLVGFQEGTKTKKEVKGQREKEGGKSMPQIAAENEFGTKTIPARPFMSTSFDENINKIQELITQQYYDVFDGKKTAKQGLDTVGIIFTGMIQQKIRQIIFPPNSPATIAMKGSSKPLIDFGQMIQSVRHKVVKG